MDTVRLNREINPTSSHVNIFYPYKGTPLGNECFEKPYVHFETKIKSPTNRFGFIEPEGILKGSKIKK